MRFRLRQKNTDGNVHRIIAETKVLLCVALKCFTRVRVCVFVSQMDNFGAPSLRAHKLWFILTRRSTQIWLRIMHTGNSNISHRKSSSSATATVRGVCVSLRLQVSGTRCSIIQPNYVAFERASTNITKCWKIDWTQYGAHVHMLLRA